MKPYCLLLTFLLESIFAIAQKMPLEKKQLEAVYTTETLVIDGNLDEPAWQTANVADSFWQNWPYDTAAAESKTEVKVLYSDRFIYVGAKCYERQKKNVIETLKRDFDFRSNDAFAFHFDPFMDGNNGFIFALNAAGAQMEGLIVNGEDYDYDWDNVWYGRVQHYDGYYIAEMAIPWKSIRFDARYNTWSVNFLRNDHASNEMSSWQALPKNLHIETLAYTGLVHFSKMPSRSSSNVSLIPYAKAVYQDFTPGEKPTIFGSGGGDAKVAVTSSLNLDLTVNPDFSQAEVDKQVTDLERFDIFFPEKRTFFLENSDLFSNLGGIEFNPFFSRRIGLYQGQQVPILFGARLSGKINQNWRTGIMDMQTEGVSSLDLKSQNYGAAILQRRVLQRSNITGFVVNRQGFTGAKMETADYNRVTGAEFKYFSKNGELSGKLSQHFALSPGISGNNTATGANISLNKENIRFDVAAEQIGRNYIAETGFVPRLYQYDPVADRVYREGFFTAGHVLGYYFYPNSKKVVFTGPETSTAFYWDDSLLLTDAYANITWVTFFTNTSSLHFAFNRDFVRLLHSEDITGEMEEPLEAGNYVNQTAGISYSLDERKNFTGRIYTEYGTFFGGRKFTANPSITWKVLPWGKLSADASYNRIVFPAPNGVQELFLLGPEIEAFFSKKLAFTTFIQYNTQIDNLNVYARLQWEFRPLSFFYIVYTDNYFPENFMKKTRAVVLKFNYWLNI